MKICPECAEGVDSESRFCPHCGFIFNSAPLQQLTSDPPDPEANPELHPQQPPQAVSQPKKICPECGQQVEKNSLSCKFCGLIFYTRPAQPIREDRPIRSTRRSPKGNPIGFALLAGIMLLTIYYFPKIRWLLEGDPTTEPRAVKSRATDLRGFDLGIDLQGRPSSLTSKEGEFLLGNNDAGTFIRISRAGDRNMIRQHRVGDMNPLAWNGNEFVAYRETGFLSNFKKYFFTKHDPATLNVRQELPAPGRIGGLAWDGAGYWAASREDNESDRGFLYRLDPDLKLVNKLVAPSPFCHGLAWDGAHLWFLDDEKKALYVLDVNGIQARIADTIDLSLKSPIGIAVEGRRVWIADSGQRRLMRLSRDMSARWLAPQTVAVASSNIKKDRLNFDEYKGTQTRSDNEVQVVSFSSEIKSNALYAGWDVHIGKNFFRHSGTRSRFFAKLTVSVEGGTLAAPIAKVYDVSSERTFQDDLALYSPIGPGTYHVRLFLYLQYVDGDGKGRILSKSIPPLKLTTGQ